MSAYPCCPVQCLLFSQGKLVAQMRGFFVIFPVVLVISYLLGARLCVDVRLRWRPAEVSFLQTKGFKGIYIEHIDHLACHPTYEKNCRLWCH